ncbi:hypothetical protein ACFL3N_00305 [Candidatus Omnitrophota bacterium]
MAQKRPDTPEKQLLKLIENPKSRKIKKEKIKHRGLQLFSFGALKGRFSFLRGRLSGIPVLSRAPLDVKAINRILFVCIFILGAVLISTMTVSEMALKQIPEFSPDASTAMKAAQQETVWALKGFKHYLAMSESRNIFDFKALERKPEAVQEVYEEVRVRPIDAELGNLRLAGISWSNNPDAMIENVSTGEMYFLKKGDLVDGKLKIEAVFRNKVVFSYKGEQAELQ